MHNSLVVGFFYKYTDTFRTFYTACQRHYICLDFTCVWGVELINLASLRNEVPEYIYKLF